MMFPAHLFVNVPANQSTMNPTHHIQSTDRPVCVATHVYASTLLRIWVRRNWYWAFALPIAAATAAAAMFSIKWLLIAVVLACLVCPQIIICVYYYHAMSPDSRMSILPHCVHATQQGIRLTYQPADENDERPFPAPDFIAAEQITAITYTDRHIILRLDNDPYKIVVHPRHSTESEKEKNQPKNRHRNTIQ